jgi:KDO2-lipid IV(A) lauroyltransferase
MTMLPGDASGNALGPADPRAGPPALGTFGQRARAAFLSALSWIVCRLPEGPLIVLAELGGELWYRLDARRARQARRNFRRVVRWLAAEGLGDPDDRAAANDPAALERLLRRAFRHYARYYLEVARTPGYTPGYLAARVRMEHEERLAEAFRAGEPVMFIGLHFGAIELMAYVSTVRSARTIVTPMETIGDPAMQGYFIRTRGSIGIRLVELREARRELTAALEQGGPVGLIADRDLTGGGMPVTFFGAPAALPLGPALLAVETGAPAWIVSVRRVGRGRYVGRLERIVPLAEGTRRERVTAFIEAQARAFEREIALAPEQWWAAFFPIWPDLEREAAA